MGTSGSISVGIDDIAIHFPRLYMDMRDFADLRGSDYGKLNKGLGLKAMARKPPPGWDDVHSEGWRAVKLPVHDLRGATSYVVVFGGEFDPKRAQAIVERFEFRKDSLSVPERRTFAVYPAANAEAARRIAAHVSALTGAGQRATVG